MRLNCWRCVFVAILAYFFVAPLAHAQAPQMLVQEAQATKYITLWSSWKSMDAATKKANPWENRGSKLGVWCANAALLDVPCMREYWKRNIKPGTKFYLPLSSGALEYMVAARKEGNLVMHTSVEGKHGVYALSAQTPEALAQKTGTPTGDATTGAVTPQSARAPQVVPGVPITVADEKRKARVITGFLTGVGLLFAGLSLLFFFAWRKEKAKGKKEVEELQNEYWPFRNHVLDRMEQANSVRYKLPPFAVAVNKGRTIDLEVVGVKSRGEYVVRAPFADKPMHLDELDAFLESEWRAGRLPYGVHWAYTAPEHENKDPDDSRVIKIPRESERKG